MKQFRYIVCGNDNIEKMKWNKSDIIWQLVPALWWWWGGGQTFGTGFYSLHDIFWEKSITETYFNVKLVSHHFPIQLPALYLGGELVFWDWI